MNSTRTMAAWGTLAALAFAPAAWAGQLNADRVTADEVKVQRIGVGLRMPEMLSYSFTNDAGTTAVDNSANGHDGSIEGASWTNAGQPAGSLVFDGVDDYVNVGSSLTVPKWGQYSLSVWFLQSGGGDPPDGCGQRLLDMTADAGYEEWYLSVRPGEGGRLAFRTAGYDYATWNWSEGGLDDSSTNYANGAWHHCVVIRNGASGQMWVDGGLKASGSLVPVEIEVPLLIGNTACWSYSLQGGWSGMIDEVRLYDRPLSSNEVTRLYTVGSLASTNVPTCVAVSTNVAIQGFLCVTGRVAFPGGVLYVKPMGDVPMGSFTNMP